MTITIRRFEDRDRPGATDLFDELNRHEAGISGDRRTDRATAEACVAGMVDDVASGAIALVAESGGVLAGLIVWAAAVDQPFVDGAFQHYGRVDDIVVAQAFRGQGVGHALLAEAERLTREAGMKRLRLTVLSGNDPAIAAYERFGFRDYARVMVRDFD